MSARTPVLNQYRLLSGVIYLVKEVGGHNTRDLDQKKRPF